MTQALAGTLSEPPGFRLLPGYLSRTQQETLVSLVMAGLQAAPAFRPSMPRSGKPMSLMMSNFGPLGWVADKSGYRYQTLHPDTGAPWPSMPRCLLDIWSAVSDWSDPPEACLVNLYGPRARLGMHIDADEDARDAPVVSISLGDKARFRLGGPSRSSKTRSFIVSSGDVVVLGGASRRFYHGVDGVLEGSSTLIPDTIGARRINLTLRRVTAPGPSSVR